MLASLCSVVLAAGKGAGVFLKVLLAGRHRSLIGDVKVKNLLDNLVLLTLFVVMKSIQGWKRCKIDFVLHSRLTRYFINLIRHGI